MEGAPTLGGTGKVPINLGQRINTNYLGKVYGTVYWTEETISVSKYLEVRNPYALMDCW